MSVYKKKITFFPFQLLEKSGVYHMFALVRLVFLVFLYPPSPLWLFRFSLRNQLSRFAGGKLASLRATPSGAARSSYSESRST